MELNPDFTRIVVDALPRDVRELLVDLDRYLLVAGGFIRDTLSNATPKDVDIFGKSVEYVQAAVDRFTTRFGDNYQRFDTPNAITFRPDAGGLDIQFITRDYQKDHMNTLLDFDFTINQAGVYFENGQWFGIASEAFLNDLPKFEMHYNATSDRSDVVDSVLRMVRFVGRGWKITEGDIAKLLGRFTKVLDTQEPLVSTSDEASHILRVVRAFCNRGFYEFPLVEEKTEEAF